MIASLQKINTLFADQIHDAVLLCEPPGPGASGKILQWLRLTETSKGFPHDSLDQIKSPQGSLAFCLYPIAQVLPELRMEDRFPRYSLSALTFTFLSQAPSPGAAFPMVPA